MKFNKRINGILERLNVSYNIYDDKDFGVGRKERRICAEMEYNTDAHNYDFVFSVELGNNPKRINEVLPKAVYDLWQDFDAEDEMLPWIENRGENGAPYSIRDILRDGDECDELLERLWNELNKEDLK